jgi:UDPglucose--hexose-1-phosphate uridylyltransferase
MYDMMNGIGAHEVIIESPRHIPNLADLEESQINKVLVTYVERITDLQRDPRFKYVLVFKNYGAAAGAGTITHSHSQLVATPVNPIQVKKKLEGGKRYFEYKERCVFCDIVRQEINSPEERLILDLDGFIALCPFASRFPFEIWILPKTHSCDFTNTDRESLGNLAKVIKLTLLKLKRALADPPYNYVLHTAPFRRSTKAGYWRTIDMDFHWHIEIIPRLTKVAGFEWGSGFYINPTPPEEAAKYLRKTEVENA